MTRWNTPMFYVHDIRWSWFEIQNIFRDLLCVCKTHRTIVYGLNVILTIRTSIFVDWKSFTIRPFMDKCTVKRKNQFVKVIEMKLFCDDLVRIGYRQRSRYAQKRCYFYQWKIGTFFSQMSCMKVNLFQEKSMQNLF